MLVIINIFSISKDLTGRAGPGRADTLHGPGRAGPKKVAPFPSIIHIKRIVLTVKSENPSVFSHRYDLKVGNTCIFDIPIAKNSKTES